MLRSTWYGIACGGVHGMGLHVGEYMAWDYIWGGGFCMGLHVGEYVVSRAYRAAKGGERACNSRTSCG